MALKGELETVEGLSADVAKEYKEVDRGGKKVFVLDIEGDLPDEIAGPLKRARDHERNGRQETEKKLKEHLSRVEALQNEIDEMRRGNIPKGDVEKLEKSWKDKLEKIQGEHTDALGARDATLREVLVQSVAQKMATELSGEAAHLILPHIEKRLTTEIQNGRFVTRVLDSEGKPSASSIEELQKEFSSDKRFAAIIVGSRASGGGANGGGNGSGASGSQRVDPKFNPNKAKPGDFVAQIRAKNAQRQ